MSEFDPATESTSAQLRRVEGELGSALSRLRVLEKRCAELEAAEAECDQARAECDRRARNEARLVNAFEILTTDTDGFDIDADADIPVGEIRRIFREATDG